MGIEQNRGDGSGPAGELAVGMDRGRGPAVRRRHEAHAGFGGVVATAPTTVPGVDQRDNDGRGRDAVMLGALAALPVHKARDSEDRVVDQDAAQDRQPEPGGDRVGDPAPTGRGWTGRSRMGDGSGGQGSDTGEVLARVVRPRSAASAEQPPPTDPRWWGSPEAMFGHQSKPPGPAREKSQEDGRADPRTRSTVVPRVEPVGHVPDRGDGPDR
jgi:hypothetical protein